MFNSPPPPPCVHEYRFRGLVFKDGDRVSGSDARVRTYSDMYYCVRCLDQRIINPRVRGTSYDKAYDGAHPQ